MSEVTPQTQFLGLASEGLKIMAAVNENPERWYRETMRELSNESFCGIMAHLICLDQQLSTLKSLCALERLRRAASGEMPPFPTELEDDDE